MFRLSRAKLSVVRETEEVRVGIRGPDSAWALPEVLGILFELIFSPGTAVQCHDGEGYAALNYLASDVFYIRDANSPTAAVQGRLQICTASRRPRPQVLSSARCDVKAKPAAGYDLSAA
jgi:hypothetical protein